MGDKERGILLVYNNKAGPGKSVEFASQAARNLSHIKYPYDLKRFSELIETPSLLEESAAVCVYGGDGTVYSMAGLISKSDKKPYLVPIPTGTENILANSLHGRKTDISGIPSRVIDTLNGGNNPLHIAQLQAGEYTAGNFPAENMFWLLTAGDSGITRRTLNTLELHQRRHKLVKNLAVLRTALARQNTNEGVQVTVYDVNGGISDKFDALEASVVKQVPGKWSRTNVAPSRDRKDQVLVIGRGRIGDSPKKAAYEILFESLKAMTGVEINEFDPNYNSRQMLTRIPLNQGETVVFEPLGKDRFNGLVADSEIKEEIFDSIKVEPTVPNPIVNVFSARSYSHE